MDSSGWKDTISFGLITIPIHLYGTARTNHNCLHQMRRGEPQRS